MRRFPPSSDGAASGPPISGRAAGLRRAAVLGLGLILLASTPALAADKPSEQLQLKVDRFDPATRRASIPDHLRLDEEPEHGQFVVQFRRPVDRASLARLRAVGAEPLHYLPQRSYIVRLAPGGKAALRAMPEVRWVGPVQPGWKISPELGRRPFLDPTGRRVGGRLYATVDLFPGSDLEAATARIAAVGADVIRTDSFSDTRRVRTRATRGQLERIARIPEVAWIEEVGEITTRNNSGTWVVQTDISGSTAIWDHGLHGEGQIVGHIDGRIDMNSCYFLDTVDNTPGPSHRKVVAYRSSNGLGADGHGTHVAGTLAGDRFPIDGTINWNGHAYAARISHANLGDINGLNNTSSNLYSYLSLAHGDGARLHTNSWGDEVFTSYTTWARDIDLYSYDFEDALVIFAVTNGSSLRSPENAKNVLAVGASLNGLSADSHCLGGSGPTSDGRRKPEIYAPGCSILSARNLVACNVTTRTGTSMAAPAITGAGALVRQYFEEGWYPSGTKIPADSRESSGALLKAMLLNSTVNMTNVAGYPSNLEGWGRVKLDDALFFDGDLRKLIVLADVRNAVGLGTGDSVSFPVVVGGDDEDLKVTLVFTDPAAPLLAIFPVINNLDLEAASPSGVVYKGNVFNTVTGVSIPSGFADTINNVEMISLPTPEIGLWTLTVKGTAVNQGSQGYALVATGSLDVTSSGTVRYASHQIDDSGPLANDDGVADPGETIVVPLTLLNQRPDPVSSVSGQLYAADPVQIKVSDGLADFPDMPTSAAGDSLAPHFRLTLAPDLACGETVRLDVDALHAAGPDASSFTFSLGSNTRTAAATDVPIGLPEFSGVPTESVLPLSDALTIESVEVTVHITHENIGELKVDLISPAGTSVTLHRLTRPGVADIDDTFPTDRVPDGPGTMNDFIGETAVGDWTLRVLDITAGDPVTPGGTLVDWSLAVTFGDGLACSPLDCAGDPVPPAVAPTMTVGKENGTDLRFDWNPAPGAAAYRIWRSASSDFAREELLAETTATTWLETDALADGVAWSYRVNAINSCEWESALDCGGEPLPRAVDGSMLLGKENGSDLRFDWSPLSGASGYRVRGAATVEFDPDQMVGESSTTGLTDLGGLGDPSTAFYLVHALNSCGWEGP